MIELTAVERVGNRIAERGVSIDPVLRRAAEFTTALVCRQLDIPIVQVRWLAANRRDIRRETLPADLTEVWVRSGQTVAATIETTTHECRHVWQLAGYRWADLGLETYEEREADAADYGRRIAAELT